MTDRRTQGHQAKLGALEAGDVEAHYDQSVLSITMPTRPEARPQKVSISTESREEISA
jgi:hypothetical protein